MRQNTFSAVRRRATRTQPSRAGIVRSANFGTIGSDYSINCDFAWLIEANSETRERIRTRLREILKDAKGIEHEIRSVVVKRTYTDPESDTIVAELKNAMGEILARARLKNGGSGTIYFKLSHREIPELM